MRTLVVLLVAAAILGYARWPPSVGTSVAPAADVGTDPGETRSTAAGPGFRPAPRVPAPSTTRSTAVAVGFHFQNALEYRFRRGDGFHNAEAIAIADIDGDGRDDLIGAASYNQTLIWRQRPDGTLADLQTHVFANDVYMNRGELSVADFNNDGIADIATSGLRQEVWGVNDEVINLVLSNRGGAPVTRQVALDGVGRLGAWQTMDIDHDGSMDIVGATTHTFPVGTRCGRDDAFDPNHCPAIGVAYGNGKGDFSRFEAILIGMPYAIVETEIGDIDGDGRKDLLGLAPLPFVFDIPDRQDVWLFRQRPGGGFEPRVTLTTLSGGSRLTSFAVGDIDHDADHRADFVSAGGAVTLRAHPQRAPGLPVETYDPFTPYDRRILRANAVLAEDVDGDRRVDAIAAQMQWLGDYGVYQIAVYPQRAGVLVEPFYVDAPSPHSGLTNRTLAIGDLNSDGCRDLAITAGGDVLGLLYGRDCMSYRRHAVRGMGIAGRAGREYRRERILFPEHMGGRPVRRTGDRR